VSVNFSLNNINDKILELRVESGGSVIETDITNIDSLIPEHIIENFRNILEEMEEFNENNKEVMKWEKKW